MKRITASWKVYSCFGHGSPMQPKVKIILKMGTAI